MKFFKTNYFFCMVFLLTILGAASSAYGSQKAWLLISLPTSDLNATNSVYFTKQNESRVEELTRIFEKRMKPLDLETKVILEATAKDLDRALNSPDSVAVFWIGHGSKQLSQTSISISGKILDFNGDDVSFLFKKIHPNIKWLGVVGCFSSRLLKDNFQAGDYRYNPVLTFSGYDGVGPPEIGLLKSTTQAWLHLLNLKKSWPLPICDWQQKVSKFPVLGYRLKVSTIDGTPSKFASFLFSGTNYLGYFPIGEKVIELWIPQRVDLSVMESIKTQPLNVSSQSFPFAISSIDQSHSWAHLGKHRAVTYPGNRTVYFLENETQSLELWPKPSDCLKNR